MVRLKTVVDEARTSITEYDPIEGMRFDASLEMAEGSEKNKYIMTLGNFLMTLPTDTTYIRNHLREDNNVSVLMDILTSQIKPLLVSLKNGSYYG